MKKRFTSTFLLPLFIFVLPYTGNSFGVLTHEAIIDALWENSIVPLIKTKYPQANATELKDAHAYAYGGAVTPDMGFYPFGSKSFTNLVHYVRSGDMVNSLLKNARNINEYAFAIGFLSHYYADNFGHPLATNKSVPDVYPKLKHKYGNQITYAEDKISHMRMEFGFDVLQITKGNYASQSYQDFIGFKIDTSVLARSFLETYGLRIDDVFNNKFSLAVESFRWIVANIIPVITRAAWASHKSEILKIDSTATGKNFRIKMRQRVYNKQYGKGYRRPGFFPTVLSFFIRVLPKVGPLRSLKFKTPTAQAEKYFIQSLDTIIQQYSSHIKQLQHSSLNLKDLDYDTGSPTASCEYILADETYDMWLLKLKENKFTHITSGQRKNILDFYAGIKKLENINVGKNCNKIFDAYKELQSINIAR
jgi:hypothetical protein